MANDITLFCDAEEVWFWFINAYQARNDGARVQANVGLYKRPCEPSDIFKILERLRRHRRLDMNHFRVLRHYGLRMIAPDKSRASELLAYNFWTEAMDVLNDVFVSKGICYPKICSQIIDFQQRREAVKSW